MPGGCCVELQPGLFTCFVAPDEQTCLGAQGAYYDDVPCDFVDCLAHISKGACCLPDGSCERLTQPECLFVRGGTSYSPLTYCGEVNCGDEPPDPPEECREAGADRVPGNRQPWDPNLCQTAMFDPTVRPAEHNPDSTGDERGNDDFAPGDCELLSAHPVRAMPAPGNADPCVSHYGMVMVAPDGTHRGVFCSQPTAGRTDQRQSVEMDVYTQVGPDPAGIMRPGDSFFAGAYHAPWYTEAQYRSFEVNCGAPE